MFYTGSEIIIFTGLHRAIRSLIADPGVMSTIPAKSHTIVEIDHEIFSVVIHLLPLVQVVSYKQKVCA